MVGKVEKEDCVMDISKAKIFHSNVLTFRDSLEVFDHSCDDIPRTTHRAKLFSYCKDAGQPVLFRHYRHFHDDEDSFSGYQTKSQDYFALFIFVEGKIGFVVSDVLYTSKFGNMILLKPKEDYTLFIYALENLEYYEIDFPVEFFEEIPEKSPFHSLFLNRKTAATELDMENTDRLFRILTRIDKSIDSEQEYTDFMVYSYLVQAVSLICNHTLSSPKQKPALTPILKKALEYISENLTSLSNTKQVSDYCNVSISYLCKMFKKHLGTSPLEYINTQKLARAKFLLKNGCNVTESCYEAGFGSYNHFVTLFKKTVGMTPTEYQKAEADEH